MALSFDDLTTNASFTKNVKGKVTFLPEPERAERHYMVISCDDHVVEPPNTFEGRIPAKFGDRVPHVISKEDGTETWVVDGLELPNVGFNAVVGRPVDEFSFDPTRFEHMRRGAWDVNARVKDMDLNGIYSSLCFPSFIPGFAGQRLYQITKDVEFSKAMTRAWNDWMLEDWCGSAPGRFIPMQLPIWSDPNEAAEEVRKNAARGFRALSFSEGPHMLGFPSLHTGHWDPLLQACEETETVVCLHVGSSGSSPATAPDAPSDAVGTLFFAYAMFAATDWLFSKVPVRFPNIKLCLSEGGIGWVAGLIDRLDHMNSYNKMYGTWNDVELTPSEVFKRNFWFCAIEDPSSFPQYEVIGADNIMVESDYPHADTTWPRTQDMLKEHFRGIPDDVVRKFTWENAAKLFRLDVPAEIVANPDAF
ncbi:MAG: amidohydrolase [Actinobacteria bacterium]|nr:amidohydrolase [Actinomycetota bacterium]